MNRQFLVSFNLRILLSTCFVILLNSFQCISQTDSIKDNSIYCKKLAIESAQLADQTYFYAQQSFFEKQPVLISNNIDTALFSINDAIISMDSAIMMASDSAILALKYAKIALKFQKKAQKILIFAKNLPNYSEKKGLLKKAMEFLENATIDAYHASFYFAGNKKRKKKEDLKDSIVSEKQITKLDIDQTLFTILKEDLNAKSETNKDELQKLTNELAKTKDPTKIASLKSQIKKLELKDKELVKKNSDAQTKLSTINTLIAEYYGKSQYIDDILVINSLKEQGIQYYRTEVKTFCQTRCSIQGKKKIVILDDIDNINEQSQQVFRNCIDKYSNNVHFISSCSNIQKVIDSLQSRKIIIKLKPFTNDRLNTILQKTKKSENLVCDAKTDRLVLSVSNGSVCVLLNYLEKFKIINEPITYDLVSKVCTNISFTVFDTYTNAVIQSNLNGAVHILYDLFDKGYSVMDIYDNYFLFVKVTDILSETQKYEIIKLLCKYITIFHNIHEDEIELALFTNNMVKLLS